LEKGMDSLRQLPREVRSLGTEVKGLVVRVSGVESRLVTVESQILQLRTEMTDGFSAIRGEMGAMKTELREDIAALARETAAGFVQVGTDMRVLFEDHIGRRAVIAEGNPPPDASSGA
jgi:hypothetical protein